MSAAGGATRSPVLVAVAHGSRDGAAQDAVSALAARIRSFAPAIDLRVAFLQHAEPSLAAALAEASGDVVIVPLLLSTGHHLTVDIYGAARHAGARVGAPLGPDPLLADALADRLAEAGAPAGTPAVLAAAGSSDPAAAADVTHQAALLADRLGTPVLAAFASGQPTVTKAVAALHVGAGGPVSVATYLLAPGQFHDQLCDTAATWVSAPLGDHPAVARVVLDRFRAARRGDAVLKDRPLA
jgi:sirohydrochlorin ferrochelatase